MGRCIAVVDAISNYNDNNNTAHASLQTHNQSQYSHSFFYLDRDCIGFEFRLNRSFIITSNITSNEFVFASKTFKWITVRVLQQDCVCD